MPVNRNTNGNGGGAKCLNLFLFVSTIMFIVDSSLSISDLKEHARERPARATEYEYTISCQIKVLTWISLSFFNYFGFMVFSYIIFLMPSETELQKRKRFKFSLAMVLAFVPFMILWNMYGNFMIKQDYFKVDYATSRTYYGGTTKRYYPAGHPAIPAANATKPANATETKEAQSNDDFLKSLNRTVEPAPTPALEPLATGGALQALADGPDERMIDPEDGAEPVPVETPTPTRKPTSSKSQPTYVPDKGELECKLDTWYQMLSILYMLLIYCEIVVFIIFSCTFLSYIKRFFLIVDEIPFEQQRRLPVSEGGRGHPLIRRSF